MGSGSSALERLPASQSDCRVDLVEGRMLSFCPWMGAASCNINIAQETELYLESFGSLASRATGSVRDLCSHMQLVRCKYHIIEHAVDEA